MAMMGPSLSEPEPGYCIHSRIEPTCASCWHGAFVRLGAQEKRIRALIEQHGDDTLKQAVADHDRYWLGANAPDESKARW